LYEEARPKKVLFAKGELKDEDGKIIAGAKIEVKSIKTNKITEGLVDDVSGKYAIAVAVEENEDLLMTVKKDDYAFTSAYLKPRTGELLTAPVKINFEMKPIEIGKEVQINDIHFATNSSLFDKESMIVLNSFIEFLNTNQRVKIEIQGHTDNVGDAKANLELSKERAKAVRDYIVIMGIDSSRITNYKGFGQTKPISSNNTEEGRAKNRRTEFVIVGK
jgi:outer membrane protein OmpA-like peptidoglycan-associated protein